MGSPIAILALLAVMVAFAIAATPTKVIDLKLERERVFEQEKEAYCKLTCVVDVYAAELESFTIFWVKATGETIQLVRVTEDGGIGAFSVEGISGNADIDKITVDNMDTEICDSSHFMCEAAVVKSTGEKEKAISTSWPGLQPGSGSPNEDSVGTLERKLADATALLQMFNMSYQNQMANREKEQERLGTVMKRLDQLEEKQNSSGGVQATCDCDNLLSSVESLNERVDEMEKGKEQELPTTETPMQCIPGFNKHSHSAYTILHFGAIGKQAPCDTHTDGGGWIIIQRRIRGNVSFNRTWEEYKKGFGSFNTDFWLGLDAMNKLTAMGDYYLRIYIRTDEGDELYAEYTVFQVMDESTEYTLKVQGYRGQTGDLENRGLAYHNNMPFSTYDRDNDHLTQLNCAGDLGGGFWYKDCGAVDINRMWTDEKGKRLPQYNTGSKSLTVDFVEMKLRLKRYDD